MHDFTAYWVPGQYRSVSLRSAFGITIVRAGVSHASSDSWRVLLIASLTYFTRTSPSLRSRMNSSLKIRRFQ